MQGCHYSVSETSSLIETFGEKLSLFGLYFEVKSLNLKIRQKSLTLDKKTDKNKGIQAKHNKMKVEIYKLNII